MSQVENTAKPFEPYVKVKDAARILNVEVWKLRGAIKRRDLRAYTPYNSRQLLRMSEVDAWIQASANDGGQDD